MLHSGSEVAELYEARRARWLPPWDEEGEGRSEMILRARARVCVQFCAHLRIHGFVNGCKWTPFS